MNKHQKPSWKFIIRLTGTILSIVLVIYLFYSIGWSEFVISLNKLSWGNIFLVLLLIFISRLATVGRWHMLLQIESVKVNWKDSLRLTFAGLFAANFLPTTIGGDVVRLAGAIRLGIDGSFVAASLMVDRLIGMTGMAIAAPLGLIPVIGNINQNSIETFQLRVFSFAFFIKNKFLQRLKRIFQKVITSFSFWVHHPRFLFLALLFTFIHMLCIFLIVDILVVGMHEWMPFWKIAGLWSLTYFITLIPVSINGLGLQEVSFINLFTIFGGISGPTGLSIALILRVLMMIGSIPGAFFISGILGGESYTKITEKFPLSME